VNPAPEVRLPRWSSLARLLLPLDLLLIGWAIALHNSPARAPSLLLCGVALLVFLAVLIQSFAWVTVIAFFARDRARDGLFAVALLGLQLASLIAVLWLAA
jgi:hypothetical protein